MTRFFGFATVAAMALTAVLVACGGSGGVGSGGTGINAGGVGIGSISGFGSVIVNDVRYATDNAMLTLEDVAELKLGMSLQVDGPVSDDATAGTATRIVSAADLRGRVTTVDAASGSVDVLGTRVTTDPATVFDGVLGLAQLTSGDLLQVHGLPAGPGTLRATRIERIAPGAAPIVSGFVEALDTVGQTFRIGALTVRYAGAAIAANAPLANGAPVRVRGITAPVVNTLTATLVQRWYEVPTTDNARVNLTGVMAGFVGLNRFTLLGASVDASSALITGGPMGSLGNGIKVEVSGTIINGVVVANRVRIRHVPGTGGPASFSLSGAVGSFVSAASFKVQGQPVDASGPMVLFTGGNVASLGNGAQIRVVGSQVVNGVLIAGEVTFP